ncbi:RS4 [Hepatospora eriocheir]|uniref:RS4 n=1 Tax=Hepatospora eriocheir TaxID=1081669 RepID=A0A1X0QHH6_9MICR|nr:RS4 [Hepatospora eriocheir]
MPSGGHRHLKRLAAPKSWGLKKSGGKYAVRPLPGSHSKATSIPIQYILSSLLDLTHTNKEVDYVLKRGLLLLNGKIINNHKRCAGLFDVITVKEANEHYRILLGINGKFKLVKISDEEAKYRYVKVISKDIENDIPYTRTSCGYNFRFADPSIKINDTVKVDIEQNKIVDKIPFQVNSTVFIYLGSNTGRVGTVQKIEKQISGKTLITLVDSSEKIFTSPMESSIAIGYDSNVEITLDNDAGIKLTAFEKSNLKYKEVEVIEE